jgi:D-glycero-alpha-D-manno-heptose-7-phosphate kinase
VFEVAARAPVRVDFGGGWTDVPPYTVEQGGCVCNLAIASYARATVCSIASGVELDADGSEYRAAHASMLRARGDATLGAAALRRAQLDCLRLEQVSEFPRGAGLGGSSAAGVAVAAALAAWRGDSLCRSELAARSRALEVEELRIAGGFQDHYAAAYGGALALTFDEDVRVHVIPLGAELVHALESQCLIAYTGESRISGATITAVLDGYRARVPRVVTALARMRALAGQMIDALACENVDELGRLVGEHWEHQRALHDRITTPSINAILDTARAHGALGGKALGASGGGSVLIIAPLERADEVRASISPLAQLLPFVVDRNGAHVTVREREESAKWLN